MNRPGKTTVAVVLVVLTVVGACLGPAYLAYCHLISGSAVGEHTLKERSPATIRLSPDMNPIRFSASIQYAEPRRVVTEKRSFFNGLLKLGDRDVWTAEFGVSHGKEEGEHGETGVMAGAPGIITALTSIKAFSVEEEGEYTFTVQPGRRADLDVRKMVLKVRRNVVLTNVPVATAGVVMLVLGVGGGLIAFFRSMKKGPQAQDEDDETASADDV